MKFWVIEATDGNGDFNERESWHEVCTVYADDEDSARLKAGKMLGREKDLQTGYFRAVETDRSQYRQKLKKRQNELVAEMKAMQLRIDRASELDHEDLVDNEMNSFNFHKVHEYMKSVGWTYLGNKESPSVNELRLTARRILTDVTKQGWGDISTGGFRAMRQPWGITLLFEFKDSGISGFM